MKPNKMTVAEAAEYYGKHEVTIRRWIAEERLVARKDPGGRDWWILGETKVKSSTEIIIFNAST